MSTRAEIEAKVNRPLRGRRLATTPAEHATALTDTVQWAISDLQARLLWPCMETTLSLSATAGTETVALGATYRAMRPDRTAEGAVYRLDGVQWVIVPMLYGHRPVTLSVLRNLYPDPTAQDTPALCTVYGRTLYLGPCPEATYSLRVLCYARLATLAAAESNWFTDSLEEAVVHLAAARCFEDLGEEAEAGRRLQIGMALAQSAWSEEWREAHRRVGPRGPRQR